MTKASLGILLMTALALAQTEKGREDPEKCATCGNRYFGTAVRWAGSPSEAAQKAKAEQKLVFVLHVSGHFEDPKFT